MKKKYIVYTLITSLLLLLIWALGKKTNIVNKRNNFVQTTTLVQNSSNSSETNKNNTTRIEWTNTTITNSKRTNIYKINKYMSILNASYIAEKFGFNPSTKSNNSEDGILIWKKANETLLINLDSNTLTYHNDLRNTKNTFIQQKNDDIINKAENYLKSVFDNKITESISPFSLSYYQQKNIYTVLSTKEKANIYRVSFTQNIDGLQTVTPSETGGIITMYLNNNLDVYQIQLENLFSTPQKDTEVDTIPINELIKNEKQKIIKVSTNSDLGTNFEIASRETIDLKQHKIDLGYLIYPNIAIPSYIIQGDINTEKGVVTEVYALPLSPIPEP